MVDGATREIWLHRLLFVGFALVLIFWKLLPLPMPMASDCASGDGWCSLSTQLARMPGPDIVLCIIFAWTMRRPDYLPVLLIAAVVLTEDILLMRPPGLWTGLVLIASEFVRGRVALARELNFAVEWLFVSGLMLAIAVVNYLAQAMVLLPQPSFGFVLMQAIWSILCYPAVVFLTQYVLGLHKPAMGEIDAYGRRI